MKIILYLIFLLVLLIGSISYREGFESQYAYLAPRDPITLDETTKNNLIAAGKKTAAVLFPEILTDEKINQVKEQMNSLKDITLEEVNYYIQNNKWPYGPYIMNYLTVNKESLLDKMKGSKFKTLEDLQKVFPTRYFYRYVIENTETQISPPPLSNDIYMGRKPPVESEPETTATIHPPFSTENYSKLQSICSTLK